MHDNMRIRRKKHLKERLENVKDYVIVPPRDIVNVLEAIKDKQYFDYEKLFGNTNPVAVEIGCGKGKFACEYAKANPDINMIAVEKSGNVIVEACETAKDMGLTNLKFIKCGAEYIEKYIKPKSVSRIFLNFSCPFPKKASNLYIG